MSHMLTNFWKRSKSASPFREREPSSRKSGNTEQSPEPQARVKMDDTVEDPLAREVTKDEYLITPDPLTSPNPSPPSPDRRETVHEHLEDTKSDILLQGHEPSHSAEHPKADMRDLDETQTRQQAKTEDSMSENDTLPPFQLTTSIASTVAYGPALEDDTASTHLGSSDDGCTDYLQTPDCNPPQPANNSAAPDLDMTDILPTGTVTDASGPTSTTLRPSLGHIVDNRDASTANHQMASRGTSVPPKAGNAIQSLASSAQLGTMTGMLTTSNMPAHIQMLNKLDGTILSLGQVPDNVRQQTINAISQSMEKIWIEAMRMGQIPVHWQEDEQTQAELGRIHCDVNKMGLKEHETTDYDVVQHEGYPRGRRMDKDQSKRKRPISPAREIVIDTRGHRGSKVYGITAGELHESGVSMLTIQTRIEAKGLDDDDELLTDILEDLELTELSEYNWKGVVPRTTCNVLGRDLKLYCLWEMQRSLPELEMLKGLLPNFSQASQIKNTQHRIIAEQELHDQLLALALELAIKENDGTDPRESRAQPQPDVGEAAGPTYISDSDDDEMEQRPQQTIEQHTPTLRDLKLAGEASFQATGIETPAPTQEYLLQNRQQVTTSMVPDLGTGQLNNDGDEAESVVEQVSGSKTMTEHRQSISVSKASSISTLVPQSLTRYQEPSAKEQRREIRDDKVDLPDTRAESASPSIATPSIPPETSIKQRAYVQLILRPKANQYLLRAGQQLVDENASWPEIRDALSAAGVHAGVRNALVKDYKQCIDNWDIPIKEEDGVLEVDDIAGYPTRKEIFNSIKPEGVTGKELQATFAGRVNFSDTKWQTLVHSVACYDRAVGRWYRKDELAEKLRHRLIVRLKVPNHKGFKLEDYSSRTVNNTQGFRWRYVSSSSVAQRHAMDEAIDAFVKHTKEGYRTRDPAGSQHVTNVRYKYPGKYEVLINPTDYVRMNFAHRQPDFEPPPAIIHGIWDFRGRKNEDKRVPGFEWFYKGKDGEVVDKWVVRHEKADDGASQGPPPPYEKIQDGTWKRVVEREIEGMRSEDQVSGKHRRVNVGKRGAEVQPNTTKRLKLGVNSMVAGTGLDGAVTPNRSTGRQRAVVIKGGAKRAGASRGGRKGKGPASSQLQPMALARARRSRTKGMRYADDGGGDDDSDGEYAP